MLSNYVARIIAILGLTAAGYDVTTSCWRDTLAPGLAGTAYTSPDSWLRSQQLGLGGEVPLDYAESEVGAREVEDLLGRIEFGVYS